MIEIPEFQYVLGCVAVGLLGVVSGAICIGVLWLWLTGSDEDYHG